jgi:hypothetical protein
MMMCSYAAADDASPEKDRFRGVRAITEQEAILVFVSGQQGRTSKRCHLADSLSKEFGITPKAIRDIWNLRTWWKSTRPYWSSSDEMHFLKRKSCGALCKSRRMSIMHELCPLSEGQAAHSPPAAQPSSDSSSRNTIHDTRRDDWIVESCKAEIMIDANKSALDATRVWNMPLPHIPDQSSSWPTTQSAKAGECSQGDGEWMIEPNTIAQDFATVFLEWQHSNAWLRCPSSRSILLRCPSTA